MAGKAGMIPQSRFVEKRKRKVAEEVIPSKPAMLRPEPKTKAQTRPMVPIDKRFRLKNANGEFLHSSGAGTTNKEVFAWWGTETQLQTMRAMNPGFEKARYVEHERD